MIRPPPRSTLFPSPTLFRSSLAAITSELAVWDKQDETRELALLRKPQGAIELDTSDLTANQVVDRKSTRLNSSHSQISYAVFCLKKKSAFDRMLSPACAAPS